MLNVALLCSRRAPGLEYLLEHCGRDLDLAAVVTTDPASDALPLLQSTGVPALVHDIREFGTARAVRPAFDAATRDLLAPYRPDFLVLSGYLHVITAPLLAAYPQRIINVHDGDLPQYRGLHATRDAMRAGEPGTLCTVHVVTEEVDAGPVLARSDVFPVGERHHYVQREWMMREAWGPLIVRGIQLLARTVFLDVPPRRLSSTSHVRTAILAQAGKP